MHKYKTSLQQESGLWEEKELRLSVLEMKAVQLALNYYFSKILEESVVLMSDNATVVTYRKNQGDTASRVMCNLAQEIVV